MHTAGKGDTVAGTVGRWVIARHIAKTQRNGINDKPIKTNVIMEMEFPNRQKQNLYLARMFIVATARTNCSQCRPA